jgi:VIT1/CCC1 family predicted Fe2+/Mn2+ transporter
VSKAVSTDLAQTTKRLLEPSDRVAEALFGLIMVLSVTLTVGLTAQGGEEGIHELLYAALGCNVAWGIIDGVMYVMSCVVQRAERDRVIRVMQEAPDQNGALQALRDALEPRLAPLAAPEDREALYRAMYRHLNGRTLSRPTVERDDVLGAVACFWLVFLSCFPAVVPFLVLTDPVVALHVSNALLLAMLFVVGALWGIQARARWLVTGSVMLAIGLALVGVAILLGG